VKNMKPKIIAAVAFIVLISGLLGAYLTREQVLVQVGTTQITDKEVRLAMKAMEAMRSEQPKDFDRSIEPVNEQGVLGALVRGHTMIELLKIKGVTDLDKLWEEESAILDWGNQLEPVKKSLGNNNAKLIKLFLVPTLANKLTFRQGYLKDGAFHQSKKNEADDLLKEALKNPQKFSELAKKENRQFLKGVWRKEKVVMYKKPTLQFNADRMGPLPRNIEEYRRDNLETLAAGQVLGHLAERNEGWWVVKKLGSVPSTKDEFNFEAFLIQRDPFMKWMRFNQNLVSVK
jgi:hypothetical protein